MLEKFILLYLFYIELPWILLLLGKRLVEKMMDRKLTKYKQISPPHVFEKQKIDASTKRYIIILTITGGTWFILMKFIRKYLIPAINYKSGETFDDEVMLNCKHIVTWYENGNPFGYSEDYYLRAKDCIEKS